MRLSLVSTVGRDTVPSRPRLYLAGGINGLGDEEVFGWRRRAAQELADVCEIVDPSERDFRGAEAANVQTIVRGDLAEIDSVDGLLVRAERPSWGTAMEIRYAYEHGKLIVVWGAGDRPSPWLVYHATYMAPTLDEAIDLLRRVSL